MSDPRSKDALPRIAIVEALRVGAPGALTEEARLAFLDDGSNLVLAELGMDSLGEMEFCIAIELKTGVTLLPAELAELKSTDAIERRIREGLDEAARTGAGTAR
jgi:acyl carrier protein